MAGVVLPRSGTIENLVVASGRLLIETVGSRHTLSTGDVIVFQADASHSYSNPDRRAGAR